MQAINLTNITCSEIAKVKKIYWCWYSSLTKLEKFKRNSEWRITNIELSSSDEFRLFEIDITDWSIEEGVIQSPNGPIVKKTINGFTPKLNEVIESYLNEMTRRDSIIVYETFDGLFYLYGGKNCKSRLEFTKSISGRNGYNLSFINIGDESSLLIVDTDHFPAAPNLQQTILEINGDEFTIIPNGNTYDLVVKDTDGNVVGEKIGSEWIVPGSLTPTGVVLHFPTGQQYTSFRTGDEGSRIQAGWFSYTKPSNPAEIADLDTTLGANYWWRLKNDLKVGGVSNKLRFVDVDGGQTWSATNNKNKITIDKLTGLGLYRIENDLGAATTWNNAIDNALTFSVVVNGITYSDFYIPTLEEIQAIFGEFSETGAGNIEDPISSVIVYDKVASSSESWTATTQSNSGGANAYTKGWNPTTYIRGVAKGSSFRPILIFDAKSLISEP